MTAPSRVRLSVIIPCWGDTTRILSWIQPLWNRPHTEWIFSLASTPWESLPELIRSHTWVCQHPTPNRGAQLNQGAALARGDYLLFHHADSHLTEAHLQALEDQMDNPGFQAGAFYRKFDQRHPELLFLEPCERWHCRNFGTLYGDQSLFVRSDIFKKTGGLSGISPARRRRTVRTTEKKTAPSLFWIHL
ncbi:MAG: glycosyltransferase [Blastochloris sp.]|nr:glycosyltransferase [Blastochloris sp.]